MTVSKTGYYTHRDCWKHEMGPGHPECPARLDAIEDRLLVTGVADALQHCEVPLASLADIELAHDRMHMAALRGLSDRLIEEEAAGGPPYVQVDTDTSMNRHTWTAALRAAGAAIEATELVLAGKASTAFCSVRPPGHHAERAAAMGFCFFNNVAVGMRHALDVHGLQRVALIDFDVHHGNGSEDIFRGDERVLMCSIFEKGLYPFNGEQAVGPNMVNVGLPTRSGSDAFRAAVSEHWIPALDAFKPELIYISAGFDAHREDDMGNLGLVEADYAWVTQELMKMADKHCKGRVISCLEGGYVLSPLARSVAAHVRVLIGAD